MEMWFDGEKGDRTFFFSFFRAVLCFVFSRCAWRYHYYYPWIFFSLFLFSFLLFVLFLLFFFLLRCTSPGYLFIFSFLFICFFSEP